MSTVPVVPSVAAQSKTNNQGANSNRSFFLQIFEVLASGSLSVDGIGVSHTLPILLAGRTLGDMSNYEVWCTTFYAISYRVCPAARASKPLRLPGSVWRIWTLDLSSFKTAFGSNLQSVHGKQSRRRTKRVQTI